MPNGKERFSDDVQEMLTVEKELLKQLLQAKLAPPVVVSMRPASELNKLLHITTGKLCCGKCTEHPDFPNEDSI